jgi:hypothetical protein
VALAACSGADGRPEMPRIVEPWWPIAGNPDLGSLTGAQQQQVDFALWAWR